MGYTLELRALAVDRLLAELREPTLDPDQIDADEPGVDEIVAQWHQHAATVTNALAQGGGPVAGDSAAYIYYVVRTLGTHFGSLDHTSSGGVDFRQRFLPGPAAAALGRPLIAHLASREIGGLRWDDHPTFGWASADELRAAAQSTADYEPPDNEDAEPIYTLQRAVQRAAQLGTDLVTAYT